MVSGWFSQVCLCVTGNYREGTTPVIRDILISDKVWLSCCVGEIGYLLSRTREKCCTGNPMGACALGMLFPLFVCSLISCLGVYYSHPCCESTVQYFNSFTSVHVVTGDRDVHIMTY